MASDPININEQLRAYMLDHSLVPDKTLESLRIETSKLKESQMQISPEQGSFMSMLIKILNAKYTLDIGVFTGYSALIVAQAINNDGKVTAIDTNIEWTNIAKKYWKIANVDHKIDLFIAPAIETLDMLILKEKSGLYDFAFIDADKVNYIEYYERSLELLHTNGLIAIDNVLWGGKVLELNSLEPATKAIKRFNNHIYNDSRVEISMLPISDGLTLARKL